MNWLKSLFQHNKGWIVPIAGSAIYAAAASLQKGKLDTTAIGVAVLTTAATLIQSPVTKTPQSAAQETVEAVVLQAANNVANGATAESRTVIEAAEQVGEDAIRETTRPSVP